MERGCPAKEEKSKPLMAVDMILSCSSKYLRPLVIGIYLTCMLLYSYIGEFMGPSYW